MGKIIAYSIIIALAVTLGVTASILFNVHNKESVTQTFVDSDYGKVYNEKSSAASSSYLFEDIVSIEVIRETDRIRRAEFIKDSILLTKPYMMITSFRDTSIVDYGTFKELDSVKCIRKAQMERVKQRRITQGENKEKELKLLNSPCEK